LLTGHCHLKWTPLETGFNRQPYFRVVTYDRNSLTHPLWVCGFSWKKISTHFMELRNYYEILSRKILHFVRGTGILAEWST
jgi:hypothetical protein